MSSEPYHYKVHIDFMGEPDTLRANCDSCGWQGVASELADIGHCSLTPGDPSPAGRCPECDALAYLFDPDEVTP
jgi:hypothetical protein